MTTKDLQARLTRLEAITNGKDRQAFYDSEAWQLVKEWYGKPIALELYNDNANPFVLLKRSEVESLLAYEDNRNELTKCLEAINDKNKAEWQERYELYKATCNKANAVRLT